MCFRSFSIFRNTCKSPATTAGLLLLIGMLQGGMAGDERETGPKPVPAPVPVFRPTLQPIAPGEFTVGVVTITFKDTAIKNSVADEIASLGIVKGRHDESGSGAPSHQSTGQGVDQEEYFKIYSNGISWPKLEPMPSDTAHYEDPYFYGYYCEYEFWDNPIGWKTRKDGDERVQKMNKAAMRFAEKNYRGQNPRFICYNYITTRHTTLTDALTEELLGFYKNRGQDNKRKRVKKARKNRRDKELQPVEMNPWDYYQPECRWADPLWPNSKIQIMDSAGGVFSHELGHSLGAPDTYHIGRFNDGIGGSPDLLAYGPTANAFSRFYHHGFIKPENHPTLTKSGSYTLHPRHIKPTGAEALGYLVPSNHPHYFYHLEYIHGENSTVGVGPSVEGMLISVVNLGRTSYLGSPDYFYAYRPGDPFFRGVGDAGNCLFGASHNRTEFNMRTEPSSRLPNLLDGGVAIKNIQERQGTLTFDLDINKQSISGSTYALSMLPQIRLDSISDIQPTSFAMDCTIKFRGEPLKTTYGFCWSKSAAPTVRDSTYALCHRECYRGHAIGLEPDTTYHVRGFATNGLGYRYSDEELVVKTLPVKQVPARIGPLCTDGFSDNEYLYTNYSLEQTSNIDSIINYSPTCVLAKLVAYYRPADFPSAVTDQKKPGPVDFNQMNWNPSDDDFPMRLDEVDGFFHSIMSRHKELELRDAKAKKDFTRNLAKITKVRSKPVLSTLSTAYLTQISTMVKADLANSRPVIVILCPEWTGENDMMCWGLIDGIDESGKFHHDLPLRRKLTRNGETTKFPTAYRSLDELIIPGYATYLVTSCHYQK